TERLFPDEGGIMLSQSFPPSMSITTRMGFAGVGLGGIPGGCAPPGLQPTAARTPVAPTPWRNLRRVMIIAVSQKAGCRLHGTRQELRSRYPPSAARLIKLAGR